METEGFVLLVPLLLNIVIAVFLYTRRDQAYQPVNKAFGLWVLTICFWYMQLIIETISISDSRLVMILFRLSLIGQWIIPSMFLFFVLRFTHERITTAKKIVLIVPALFFVTLIILDILFGKVVINTIRYNNYGGLSRSILYVMHSLLAWLIYFITYITWGIVLLVRHILRTTVAFYDRQWRSLFLQRNFLLAAGGVLIFILGLTLDIIIPIVNFHIFPVSSLTTLIMVCFVGYLLYQVEKS